MEVSQKRPPLLTSEFWFLQSNKIRSFRPACAVCFCTSSWRSETSDYKLRHQRRRGNHPMHFQSVSPEALIPDNRVLSSSSAISCPHPFVGFCTCTVYPRFSSFFVSVVCFTNQAITVFQSVSQSVDCDWIFSVNSVARQLWIRSTSKVSRAGFRPILAPLPLFRVVEVWEDSSRIQRRMVDWGIFYKWLVLQVHA